MTYAQNKRTFYNLKVLCKNSSHIRTILNLDTYGPQHSSTVADARKVELLPLSPNTDRFQATSRPTTAAYNTSDDVGNLNKIVTSNCDPISTIQFDTQHGIYEDTSTQGSTVTDAHTRGVRWALQRSESLKVFILTVLIVFYILQKLKQIREARRIQKEFKHQRLKEANAASDMIREFEIRSKSVKPYL